MLKDAAPLQDKRAGDLTLEELEILLEERRRIERARAFAEVDETRRFRPITIEPHEQRRKNRRKRAWRDSLLLLVEVLAVVAFLVLIAAFVVNLQALNQEVALAVRGQSTFERIPSAAPSNAPSEPLRELPGSSFPPPSYGELPGSSFPPDALPASIGVNVAPAPSPPLPTPGPESPTRLVIPAIGVDWPIVPGDGWEELKRGVGHHIGSANPGERGNMVLSGHNDVYGEVFKDLEMLKYGDEVLVYAGGRVFKYLVRAKRIVAPTDLSVLNPTREAIVTLITCYPYRVDTHRLVVVAQLAP